jgi:single-stranded-DNA-specific exonuclease
MSEVLAERNEEKFFSDLKKFANTIKERDNFALIFHHDADGVTSGSIALNTLKRLGKKVEYLCLKQLYKEDVETIKKMGSTYLFVDFGSGQLDYLKEELGAGNVFVLDHHIPIPFSEMKNELKTIDKKELEDLVNDSITLGTNIPRHINPLLYGIDGGKELSGAGVSFFFSISVDEKNKDLVALAIIGALGDMQDFTGKLVGMNRKLLKIANEEKTLSSKIDLRLYGRISRPLVSYLLFSSSPILPDLTANQQSCINFFNDLGIALKDSHDKYKSYEDLSEEEKRKISTALIMHLNNYNFPDWKIKELIGEVYTIEGEYKKSPLRDAKEFATVLNACARNKQTDIAVNVCLGDRDPFGEYGKALSMLAQHKENLRKGIEFVEKNGVEEKKNFYFFDASGEIDESIVGVIAGMLYGSVIPETKPIIAMAENEDDEIKISGRATTTILKKGINLGSAFKKLGNKIEGLEGGGHCLHPNTLIQKKNGEIVKIKEIMKNDNILSNKNFNIINAKCNKTFKTKKNKIVSIKTNNSKIKCSQDHIFFKYENFEVKEVKAKDLKEKDFVLGIKKIDFEGKDIKLENNSFIYLSEKGISKLKKERIKNNLSVSELAKKIRLLKKKEYLIYGLESFKTHRLKKNELDECLSFFKINKEFFYKKFVKKELVCNTNFLNEDISWLLGYIQGDGNIGKKRIEFKEPNKEIIAKVKKSIKNNFNLSSKIVEMITYKKIRIYSADLCRFFETNFPESKILSGKLSVPSKIMQSNNKLLARYIRGIFDAESTVYDRFIAVSMVDKNLLKTIQLLLLRFGIISNFRSVKNKKKIPGKKQFVLDINDFNSLKLYKKYIGFTKNSKKYKSLNGILLSQEKKKRNSQFFSPITYGNLRNIIKKNTKSKKLFSNSLLYSRDRKKRMNFTSLEKYLINSVMKNKDLFDDETIKKINFLKKVCYDNNFWLYEIKSKEISKYSGEFYDLSIPKTKNFIANNLVVHNSIAAGCKFPKKEKEKFLGLLEEEFENQTK